MKSRNEDDGMLQNVKVSLNRSVTPKRIVVGNQFESGVEQIHFDIPDMEGYKYLVLNKPNKEESYPIPLDEGTFYIDSRVTYYLDGVWIANAVISKSAVTEGKLNPDVVTFISDDIILIVKNNYINNEYLKDLPLPQNLQIVYDKLFDTYTQIKSDYDSGAFDGKDGYSPTLDVTPIDNGNRITITDINGEKEIDVTNGIDGQSAYELAVKNGFEGTEEEWIESLRYDHSDEFKQLAEQVKLDANSAADSATKAENAMNEANTTAQENVEAINQASTNAQNAITTTKDNAVQAVQSAQQTAENAIGTKQAEAVQAVDTAKTSATQEITEQKESAVSAITQERSEAIEAIETGRIEALNDIATDKTGALTAIETAKDEAIEEIENTGVPLEDIEKLAIKETAEGNPTIISDSADWRLQNLNVYGQSSQDGTPTPENPVEIISKEISEIKVTGVNVLKLEDIEETTKDGITYSVKDGLIKVKGTAERNYLINFYGSQRDIVLLAGQTYIFNPNPIKGTETMNMYLDFTNRITLGFSIASRNINIPKTLTKEQAKYAFSLSFVYQTGQTVDMEYKPQVLMSNVLLPYEPYKSQTITLTEPITLRGIPVDNGGNVTIDGQQYTSDVICEKDGVIGVERNIGFKSYQSQEFKGITQGESFTALQVELSKWDDTSYICRPIPIISNKFIKGTANVGEVSAQTISDSGWSGYARAILRLSKDIDTKEEFEESIGVGLNFAYQILPTFEPLPEDVQSQIKALKSYYPNTVIDTGAWTKVEYVVDTQKWIEKKITGVTELALGGQ